MTEVLPKCNLCGTELPDPNSPCECTPGELPYRPSEEAIAWVACNMSAQHYQDDWIVYGCRTFEAGRESLATQIRAILEDGHEDGCNACANIAELLLGPE